MLGCQITVANFTKVDGHLLCRIHYMKKVMESGGKHGGEEKFRVNSQSDRFKQYSTKNISQAIPEAILQPTDDVEMKTTIQSQPVTLEEALPTPPIPIEANSENVDATSDVVRDSAASVEDLLQEIECLRSELAEERERRRALDEECDSLAMANCVLTEELATLRRRSSLLNPPRLSPPSPSEEMVITEGDNNYAKHEMLKLNNAAGGSNVLSVCFLEQGLHDEQLLVCGGADKKVYGYSKSGELVFTHDLTAPVLSVASHHDLLAISCMDGSHAILRTSDNLKISFHDHSKYVIFIRWSVSGKFLATACYDKSVKIYAIK